MRPEFLRVFLPTLGKEHNVRFFRLISCSFVIILARLNRGPTDGLNV